MRMFTRLKKFSISSLFERATRRFRRRSQASKIVKKKDLEGEFYIERICENGDFSLERIQAKRLVHKNGRLILYGWSSMLPTFRGLPVDGIIKIADCKTGEIVPRIDIKRWLLSRTAQ